MTVRQFVVKCDVLDVLKTKVVHCSLDNLQYSGIEYAFWWRLGSVGAPSYFSVIFTKEAAVVT